MPPPISRTKPAFRLESPETGTTYSIYVALPEPELIGPRIAVLLMDGDYFFDPAVAAAQELSAHGQIAPALIVGVGYGAGFGAKNNRRGRDYTPVASSLEPGSGGAEPFLRFLAATLWPELARRYPVREDARGIGGHSLGSLLVLHALFQSTPFFNLALASAPSIWWEDRAILASIAQRRAAQASLNGTLYLGVGADDTASMTGDLKLLEEQLAAHPFEGLRVVTERYTGRDHYDVAPDTLRGGLQALLGVK